MLFRPSRLVFVALPLGIACSSGDGVSPFDGGSGGRDGEASGGDQAGDLAGGGGGTPGLGGRNGQNDQAGQSGQAGQAGQAGQSGQAGAGGQGGAVPTGSYDVEAYVLRGAYDWDAGALLASVDVTFRGPAEGLAALELDVNVNAVRVDGVWAPGGGGLPFSVGPADGRGDAKLRVDLAALGPALGQTTTLRVDYRATPWVSLSAVRPGLGDPATGRVVYTASEPLGVAEWMPCHNDPSDRARVSIALEVPAGEALVANGSVVGDEPLAGGSRRITYATSYPLPTYLMAFALGGLEAERSQAGSLPLAVWHRAGVAADYEGLLEELRRLVPLYEGLLGVAYPFEKYELVLLPEFRFGGLEHAGITFQAEDISTDPFETKVDLLVTAHELAHQWFGDLVTVATWDDLWIKEGMATLLEHEGTRLYLDESGAGLRNGDLWSPVDGYAIRDVSLPPAAKYTPGPYDRAAWLLTQLRALVGEAGFWNALRGVLEANAFGTISTGRFLEAFRPALSAEAFARVEGAVDAHALFAVRVQPPASPGAGPTVSIDDPEGSLLAPMGLRWLRADGTASDAALGVEPFELRREGPDDLLVIDPGDSHPVWPLARYGDGGFDDHQAYGDYVAPLRQPTAAQIERFAALAGAHQEGALAEGPLPPVSAAGLPAWLEALDSPYAEAIALERACELAATEPSAWAPALREVLATRPNYRAGRRYQREGCAEAVDVTALFADDRAALAGGAPVAAMPEARLKFLSSLVTGLTPSVALGAWGRVVEQGHSVRVRANAAYALEAFVTRRPEAIPAGDRPAWREVVVRAMNGTHQTRVLERLVSVLVRARAESAAENADGLGALAAAIVATGSSTRGYFVASAGTCAGYQLAAGDEAAWQEFVTPLLAAELDPDIHQAIASIADYPDGCAFDDRSGAPALVAGARRARPAGARALEAKGDAPTGGASATRR